MAGFNYSLGKSNNAVQAQVAGLKTKSEINASLLKKHGIDITLKDFMMLLDDGYISPNEWHHTNATFFNETNYYDIKEIAWEIKEERQAYEDRIAFLKEQKKREEEGDVVYAHILVTFVTNVGSKRTPRYEVEEVKYLAQLTDYYSGKKFAKIRTSKGDSFRKTHKYIKIERMTTKEIFDAAAKREDLKELRTYKQMLLEKAKPLNDEAMNKKIKYAKKWRSLFAIGNEIDAMREAQREQQKQEELRQEELKRQEELRQAELKRQEKLRQAELKWQEWLKRTEGLSDDMAVAEWAALPEERKHPAPRRIVEMKKSSGLSWREFESLLTPTKENASKESAC